MSDKAKEQAQQPQQQFEKVPLDTPVKRGEEVIKVITLRKPRSGELRGVALTDVLQMDVNALNKVLPRITQPSLSEMEVMNLDPADLVQIGTALSGFLLSRKLRGEMENPES